MWLIKERSEIKSDFGVRNGEVLGQLGEWWDELF